MLTPWPLLSFPALYAIHIFSLQQKLMACPVSVHACQHEVATVLRVAC